MAPSTKSGRGTGTVTTMMNYTVSTDEPLRTYFLTDPPPGVPASNEERQSHQVPVASMREIESGAHLDTHGFELVEFRTTVNDIYDAGQRETVYVPEVAALIKRVTGAAEVRIFTHFLRGPEAQRRDPESISFTADFVHADYTPKSGPAAFRELLGEQAEQYSGHRFAIINVWRPIVGPLQDRPLAVCDATSVATDDLLPWMTVTRLDEKGLRSSTGEIREDESYVTAWNPEHRWYYAPDMMPTEALLFKTYDSDTDQPRFTPHTAFNDPATPADAPPRASIDVRALVVW